MTAMRASVALANGGSVACVDLMSALRGAVVVWWWGVGGGGGGGGGSGVVGGMWHVACRARSVACSICCVVCVRDPICMHPTQHTPPHHHCLRPAVHPCALPCAVRASFGDDLLLLGDDDEEGR